MHIRRNSELLPVCSVLSSQSSELVFTLLCLKMKLQRSATESQNLEELKDGDDSDRCSVSQSKLFVN